MVELIDGDLGAQGVDGRRQVGPVGTSRRVVGAATVLDGNTEALLTSQVTSSELACNSQFAASGHITAAAAHSESLCLDKHGIAAGRDSPWLPSCSTPPATTPDICSAAISSLSKLWRDLQIYSFREGAGRRCQLSHPANEPWDKRGRDIAQAADVRENAVDERG